MSDKQGTYGCGTLSVTGSNFGQGSEYVTSITINEYLRLKRIEDREQGSFDKINGLKKCLLRLAFNESNFRSKPKDRHNPASSSYPFSPNTVSLLIAGVTEEDMEYFIVNKECECKKGKKGNDNQ